MYFVEKVKLGEGTELYDGRRTVGISIKKLTHGQKNQHSWPESTENFTLKEQTRKLRRDRDTQQTGEPATC